MIAFTKIYIIQIETNFQFQLIMDFIEMILELFFISASIFILMATPIVLFYYALDNYFKWRDSKKLINKDLCSGNHKSHSTYVYEVCDLYKKTFTKLISNVSGLIAWNLFSILYISINFTNFKTGISNYFLFPFDVIETYKINYSIETLSQFKSQIFYMFLIFIISILFFQFGKLFAQYLLKNNLSLRLKDKLFTNNYLSESTFIDV